MYSFICKFICKIVFAFVIVFLSSGSSLKTYAREARWLTLFCATKDLPTQNYFAELSALTSQEYPGVGHFIYLGSQEKETINFDDRVDWYRNNQPFEHYPNPIGDMPRRELAIDCIRSAYESGHFQKVATRGINEYEGVFLVNDMGATAVAWYNAMGPVYGINIVFSDGTPFDRPVIMSDLNHLKNHHVLAHELGHGHQIFHAGGGFDPMGFGNVHKNITPLSYTHSFFMGMHRRFMDWTDPHNTVVINPGESKTVELTALGDFLLDRQKWDQDKIEIIVNQPSEQYSIEYRRFISYDTNISAEGVTIHRAAIENNIPQLRLSQTLSFPYSSNKKYPQVLLPGDAWVDAQKGIIVSVKEMAFDGKWGIEVHNYSAPLTRVSYPHGVPHLIPGRIQAENYDRGYNTWTYYDLDLTNHGGKYRINEPVDIEETLDNLGGYHVSHTRSGEFLDYTVYVEGDTEGTYHIELRGSQWWKDQPNLIRFYLDSVQLGKDLVFFGTGGWNEWKTFVSDSFSMTPGEHILRVELIKTPGVNINWIDIVKD